MTSKKEWNILSTDISKNSIDTESIISSLAISFRVGMWGEAMFGYPLLLGGGLMSSYLSQGAKNILSVDLSKNVSNLPSTLYRLELTIRPGMWGEAMFGSEDILGAGTLNYYEG